MNLIKPITAIWPNIARACEIAMVGNFYIAVIPASKEYHNFDDDMIIVKREFQGVFFVHPSMAHIVIELTPPDPFGSPKGETIEEIIRRALEHQKKVQLITTDLTVTNSAYEILKLATNKKGLSLKQIYYVIGVAKVIAIMDTSKNIIEAVHMAEAIMYAWEKPINEE